jgi:hypothetical protein
LLQAAEPKKPRPGRPFCFRLEIWETKDDWDQPAKDSQGNWKFIVDAGTEEDKTHWMTRINGTRESEPEPEPEPEAEAEAEAEPEAGT